ncbi:F-box and leucine-rich repeat protein 13-like [Anopheles ziemanni]|uniref:F-box and leucine-rich repeat protein 13-like n=1 Tax=Anopheles coustani TaxID=139045 RepID=UPI002657BDDC|nr:F-box and leucine-rich repeat protein 13-like [Anopheles coustani]XP_058170615.1 F-box and leucine-rich repeat protein 13-like [Anopheles ziemanni]
MAFQADLGSIGTKSIEIDEKNESAARLPDLAPYDVNYDEFGPRFADLPMEILLKMFSYLTPSERREAGLTCRRWYEATHHTAFMDRYWLVLKRFESDENELFMQHLLDYSHHFPNIELREVDFDRLGNFFAQFGLHIRRIVFDACDLEERTLFTILSHLSGLQSLSIRSCQIPYTSKSVLDENPTEQAALRQTLSGVTELSVANINDTLLDRLVECMPSLCSLGLVRRVMYFNSERLRRKFFPGYIFKNCFNSARELKELPVMVPELQLKRLELEETTGIGPRCGNAMETVNLFFSMLLRTQANHLQHLNLSTWYKMGNHTLKQICQELPGLRVLKMRKCKISNQGLQQLSQLTQLEVLDISYCKAINGEGIVDGIASKKNDVLRELYIGGLDLSERSIIAITETLGELRVLDLGYCFHAMSDLCVQFICRNLVRLTHLTLDGCRKVSDGGLTGLGMLEQVQHHMQAATEDSSTEGNRIQNAHQKAAAPEADEVQPKLTVPQVQPIRIPLRRCAEQEIVNDAERKRQRMEAMEQKESMSQQASSSTTAFSCYSIERLQQLRVLNLAGCYSLTDVSLLFNFRLVELRKLSLAACKQFTHEGVHALVRDCPAIEQLDLSECYNIKDETVRQIVIHLRRLRVLSLRGCYQLTDYSLDYIASHCHRLRVLDVRGCKQMDGEPARRLVNLKQLTTIHKGE